MLGPGQLLAESDKAVLRDLLDGKRGTQRERLPSQLLVKDRRELICERPRVRAAHVPAIGKRSQRIDLLWLSLVFHAGIDGRLRLAAYVGKRKPAPATRLFHAPLWNVYADSRLCNGNVDKPDTLDNAAMTLWERAVFDSKFSHSNHDDYAPVEGAVAYLELLKSKAEPGSRWTARDMMPMMMTVDEWLLHGF